MNAILRGITGFVVFLFTTGVGIMIGVHAAFWYVYFFIDEDRTGNAGIGTNMAFLGAAFVFGLLGFFAGCIAAWRLLVWAFSSKGSSAHAISPGDAR
jgi:hypothetical protein